MVSGSKVGSSHAPPPTPTARAHAHPGGAHLGLERVSSLLFSQGKATCKSGAGRTEQPSSPCHFHLDCPGYGAVEGACPDLLCSLNLKDLYPSMGDTEVKW